MMRSWRPVRMLLVVVLVLVVFLALNPIGRMQFFNIFGLETWAFKNLTTSPEKVIILNAWHLYNYHISPRGPTPEPRLRSTGTGFGLRPFDDLVVWVNYGDPFTVVVTTGRPPGDGDLSIQVLEDGTDVYLPTVEHWTRTSLERLDENTLVYHHPRFPIKLTFTRLPLDAEDFRSEGRELVKMLTEASLDPR